MGSQLRVLCPESIGLSRSHTNLICDFFFFNSEDHFGKDLEF